METCSCYHEVTTHINDGYGKFKHETRYECYGTKEREECTCGGDRTKCNFYPDIKLAAELKNKETIGETTIYYAHHQWKYYTEIEDYELELIKKYFPHAKIFNPSTDLLSRDCGDEDKIMEECLKTVRNSDIVVFSAMDGMIGKGVYQEISMAKICNKLILVLSQNKLTTEFYIDETPQFNSDRLYARASIPTSRC